jgi:predicted ester cyclase
MPPSKPPPTTCQAFPDLRVTVEDLIAEGGRVAAHLGFRGTHLGESNGIAPTDRRVDCTGIVISRIEGGKIAEDRANFDDLGLMQQLIVIPEPGQQPLLLRCLVRRVVKGSRV